MKAFAVAGALMAVLLVGGGMTSALPALAAEKPILGEMKVDNEPAVAAVRDALVQFQRSHGHWPATLDELAAEAKPALDLAAFSSTTYLTRNYERSTAALFEFTMAASGAKGAFALSFFDGQ